MGSTCCKGKGRFQGFFISISLNGIFFNRNVYDLCVKKLTLFPYGQYIVGAFQRNSQFNIEVWVYEKFAKMEQSFHAKIMPSSNTKQQPFTLG